MDCIYCKVDGAERVDGIALCPGCKARFVAVATPDGISIRQRDIRPQSLAREGYERAYAQRQESRR